MDISGHQLTKRGVDGAMPGKRRHPGERVADDADVEVPAPILRPGVAYVPMAVVAHLQLRGQERSLQRIADRSAPGLPG